MNSYSKYVLATLIGLSASMSLAATKAQILAKAKQVDMYCGTDITPTVETVKIQFKYSYQEPQDKPQTATYHIVSCLAGAYNVSSVLVADTSEGLQLVSFADANINAAGKVAGFTASNVVGDLTYNPKTKIFSTFSKGRGIGDVSLSSSYAFKDGSLVLVEVNYDGTEDEQINPKTIYKNTQAL